MTATTTEQRTQWRLTGKGYEFCNCNPGCTCNFSGFPSSSDGSCKAMVGVDITSGHCGDVDLTGLKSVSLIDWPKAIHDGNGKAVLVVEPECTDEQLGALAQIYGGELGGMPWEILAGTLTGVAVAKGRITIEQNGMDTTLSVEGIGTARGRYFANPVTGERHEVAIELSEGFIWRKGECGVGDFEASAEDVSLSFKDTNWIFYEFDWSNAG